MSQHICKLCNSHFSSKQMLNKHENKKNKCNQETDHKCNNCNKYFKQKNNLIEHQRKDICNKNKNIEIHQETNIVVDEKTIKEIITSDTNNKILLLKTIGVKLSDDDIHNIINSKISIEAKIVVIKSCISKNQSIINNNSNNTINNTVNNININNFDNENIDYLTPKYIEKILINLLLNKKGKECFLKLSNEIYLNKDKLNNNTIKVDNLNNKYCQIIKDNKWITTTKNSALKKIFVKVADIILTIMEDITDKIPEVQRKIVSNYLNLDFEHQYIKETMCDFILNIYNFNNTT